MSYQDADRRTMDYFAAHNVPPLCLALQHPEGAYSKVLILTKGVVLIGHRNEMSVCLWQF